MDVAEGGGGDVIVGGCGVEDGPEGGVAVFVLSAGGWLLLLLFALLLGDSFRSMAVVWGGDEVGRRIEGEKKIKCFADLLFLESDCKSWSR